MNKPAEDHGIGNVGDVEFIEAKKLRLLRNGGGGNPDRILAADLAQLCLLPQCVDALVHLGHEFMEVDATLAHDG